MYLFIVDIGYEIKVYNKSYEYHKCYVHQIK